MPRVTPGAAVWALASAVLGGVALVLVAPVLPRWPAAIIYGVASLVCHQRPDRSFYWGPVQFAVCARCTGLYAGAAIGVVAGLIAGHRRLVAGVPAIRRALVIAAIPTAATVAAEWTGLWAPARTVRAVAGLPLGAAIAVVLAVAAAMMGNAWFKFPRRTETSEGLDGKRRRP